MRKFVFTFILATSICLLTIPPTKAGNDITASPTEVSYPYLNRLPAGTAITFWIKYKNTGTTAWTKENIFLKARDLDSSGKGLFWHKLWWTDAIAGHLTEQSTAPGEIGQFRFALLATYPGAKWPKFYLELNGQNVTGSSLEVPLQVLPTENGSKNNTAKNIPAENNTAEITGEEPSIRVGIFSAAEPIKIKSESAYQIIGADGKTYLTLTTGEEIETFYNKKSYYINREAKRLLTSTDPFRFSGDILEISNYEDRPAWNSALNDNRFRGELTLKYAPKTNKIWVINTLPLETYLKGLAEVNESQPLEHIKTIVIAARTYAKRYIDKGGRHPDESYDLNNTPNDQVYKGYGFEKRAPALTQAVETTRGEVVTYNGNLVVTPYSSGTCGRTLSFSEVWNGTDEDYPWLVSVPDPNGVIANCQTLSGNHMVGLSSTGSQAMAKAGKNYQDILKYYYTGVEVKKMY